MPGWSKDSNTHSKQPLNPASKSSAARQNSTAPINLSLSEDERSPNRSGTETSSPQHSKAHAGVGQQAGSSPPEEEEALYEYFPLSVDDWYAYPP